MTNDAIKATGKRNFRNTFTAVANFLIFAVVGFVAAKNILNELNSPSRYFDSEIFPLYVAALLTSILVAFLSLKMFATSPTFYFEHDGFTIGKDGEKISYRDLRYHFQPGAKANTFMTLWIKVNGKFKNFNASLYHEDAFSAFQKDHVKVNLPLALAKIERGETVDFLAAKPAFLFGTKVTQFEEKGLTVKVHQTGIRIEDNQNPAEATENYSWSDYIILSKAIGTLQILDAQTKELILDLNTNYMIAQPNLFTALILLLVDAKLSEEELKEVFRNKDEDEDDLEDDE